MLLRKFQQFMIGRYGTDSLNIALLAVGLVCSLCGSLFFRPLVIAADVLFLLAVFRMFSRNIPARQRENQKFYRVWMPVQNWLRLQKQKLALRKQYRYFKCPRCRQQLRAPRGRGEIEVTCQKCGNVFRTRC